MIDFKPDLNPYNKFNELSPFKFHVREAFPYLEADFDALNEYQLLSLVVKYLNQTIANMNIAEENISIEEQNIQALYNAYSSLQDYVNNYFDNLDVQDEINNKLNSMVQDGSLLAVITPYLQPLIDAQNGRIDNIFNIVQSLVPGSPKGTYSRIEDLRNANPETGVYIITANGHIYSWTKNQSTTPVDLGVYQATGIDVNDKYLQTTIEKINIDNNQIISNALIIASGEIRTNVNEWEATDFIDVFGAGGSNVIFYSALYGTGSTVWYDENKNQIGYINGNNASDYGITFTGSAKEYSIKLPDNVRYVRMSNYIHSSQASMYIIKGYFNDKSNIKELNKKVSNIEPLIEIVPIQYTNLVNPDKVNVNHSVIKNTGDITTSNYFDATDFIYLQPNTTYYVGQIYLTDFYAFYDNNLNFVSNADVTIDGSGYSGSITTHDTSYYFRGSIHHESTYEPFISSIATTYKPYGLSTINDMIKDIAGVEKTNRTKILVMGDSISTDAYGSYKKWVTDLMEDGFLPANTNNNSYHATGFVATYKEGGVVKQDTFYNRIVNIADKDDYDMVITFGGINDYIQNIPWNDFTSAVDTYMAYLIENFTNARIVFLAPLRTYATWANTQGKYVVDYANYIKEKAKYYCFPVLNLTEESGFCPYIQTFRDRWSLTPAGYTSSDGVHPNEQYEKEFLAPMIKKFLKDL